MEQCTGNGRSLSEDMTLYDKIGGRKPVLLERPFQRDGVCNRKV